ncbi:MAG: CDP-diacylglycerol--glycerol-3-phosphate 3-phosphatidyltransferase [Bacteroidota bacterium]|nr:CDP-diacylglycerol--glycerol-3-phosphate 3-phosphatidyltransferase [Bacteroidota bacterium]
MYRIPISPPNQLTLLRILLTPVFVYFLFSVDPVNKQIALGIFIFAAITDWYDGYVARRWGFITRWGKFLDPLADKVLTSAAFFSFVAIGYAELWMVILIVVRDFSMTLLRAYAEYKNTPINTSGFAKTKTVVQLIVIYLFLVNYIVRTSMELNIQFGWIFDIAATPIIMYVLMMVTTILTVWTGVVYLSTNRIILKKLFSSESNDTDTERIAS